MSVYQNDVPCDLYIGRGAGKKLLEEIKSAEKSVRVISPYLSPHLTEELIKLHEEGREIELITMDRIEGSKKDSDAVIKQLIRQVRETDREALHRRDGWRDFAKILKNIAWSLAGFTGGLALILRTYKDFRFLPSLVLLLLFIYLAGRYREKTRNLRVYTYSYKKLFPFMVYFSPYTLQRKRNGSFMIHSKIFLIDDRIAYLGSVNFTRAGTKDNHETRTRTIDPEAVAKIKKEFDALMHHEELPFLDIQSVGKELYAEPPN